MLQKHARENGVMLECGITVNEVHRVEGGWELELSDGRKITARLLIGADGRRSPMAKKTGLKPPAQEERVAIHALAKTPLGMGGHGEMHLCHHGAYLGICPVGDHEANVTAVLNREALLGYRPREVLEELLLEHPKLRLALGQDWSEVKCTYPLRNRVRSVVGERVALVGDASGFYDPLTGEGMTCALLSGRLLAEALLAQTDEDWLDDPSRPLARYADKRRRALAPKGRVHRAFQWLIRHPDLCDGIGRFLGRSASRQNAFVGLIANTRPVLPLFCRSILG
jgi:flavin-dependent dehydrogenase